MNSVFAKTWVAMAVLGLAAVVAAETAVPGPSGKPAATPTAPRNPPARTITGRVLDRPGGKPVEGAEVLLRSYPWTQMARTDRTGNYAFTAAPYHEPYELTVVKQPQGVWVEGIFIRVGDADVRADDLFLVRPQSIAGTVRDTEGRPVAGIEINVGSARSSSPSAGAPALNFDASRAYTDDRGQYRLYVVPRTVEVYCFGTVDRYALVDQPKEVTVAAGKEMAGVDFTVKSAPPFHGQVVLPDGQSARRAELDVVLLDVEGKARAGGDGMVGDGTRDFHLQADDEGRFTGYLLGPWGLACRGKVTLKLMVRSSDRSMSAIAKAETMADAAPFQVKVTLAPAATIIYRIVSKEGKAIENAEVFVTDARWLHFSHARSSPVTRLGDGRYRAGGLLPSTGYFVSVIARGYRTYDTDHEPLALGQGESRDVPLVLQPWSKGDIPNLLKQLSDDPRVEVAEGERGLCELGAEARSAEPEVLKLLAAEGSTHLRLVTIRVLGSIGSPSSVAALEPFLTHSDPEIRQAAADSIARIRAAPTENKPASQ